MEHAFINKTIFGTYDLISTETGKVLDTYEELPEWATKTIYTIEDGSTQAQEGNG